MIISCKKNDNNNNKELEIVKIHNNLDDQSYICFEVLKNNGFIFPSEEIYDAKLKEVFGLDLSSYSNTNEIEINPRPIVSDDQKSNPIAVRSKRFILWYPNPSTGDEDKDNLAIININKYIFYNDKASFVYLKSQTELDYLFSLVQDFGYKKDKELIDYFFKKTQGDLSDNFAFNIFFGRNGMNGKWELRKELLDSYLETYPKADIYGSGFTEVLIDKDNPEYIVKYEGNREKDLAFLLEKIIYQARERGDLNDGAVDKLLETHSDYLKMLIKNKAFEYPLLNDYIRQGPSLPNYIINDPDGYTNLRREKNTSSQIIEKVSSGEEISIIDNTGDWWYVKTKTNNMGYIHKSKLKLK